MYLDLEDLKQTQFDEKVKKKKDFFVFLFLMERFPLPEREKK